MMGLWIREQATDVGIREKKLWDMGEKSHKEDLY